MSSTIIDQRLVQLRFDNSNFEKNVNNTLATLDKLKKSLKMDGAVKGISDVEKASSKFNMSNMEKSASTVSLKFSALQVAGITALTNITNSAVEAGKKIVSALTIDPIMSGFSEYQLKMNSVQTIMASTGASLAEVNDYLQELNLYADRTIYSFSDMTENIGKFTNAGVKLDKAVAAIKGVSNEAAVSGANANEASRAMYNFAQALSAGYVKLIDWKSIENANMATVEFKNELIKTALALGTITQQGDKYVTTTTDLNGKVSDAFNSVSNFNESLAHQWMTTEVLTDTLSKYSDETTEIGKKAYAAAQDVKTFTQLFDTLTEAAQSGWGVTWELIVGDFNEAKSLLSGISATVGGFIDNMSDARNAILKAALTDKWKNFSETLATCGITATNLQSKLSSMADSSKYDIKKLSTDTDYFKQSLKDGWMTADIAKNVINEYIISLEGMSDEQLKAAGYTKENIKSLKELAEQSNITGSDFNYLINTMDQMGGRELAIEGMKNILSTIGQIINAIAIAWSKVFLGIKGSGINELLKRFYEFSKNLKISESTINSITNSFEAFFSVLHLITSLLIGPMKVGLSVLKLLGKIITSINWNPLIKSISTVSEGITAFIKKIENLFNGLINGMISLNEITFDSIIGAIKGFVDNIIKSLSAISSPFGYVGDAISDLLDKLFDAFKDLSSVASPFIDIIKSLFDVLKDVFMTNGALGTIITGIFSLSVIMLIKKMTSAVGGFTKVLGSLKNSINGVLNSFKNEHNAKALDSKSSAFVKMATSLAIASGALLTISKIDIKDAPKVLLTFSVISGVLTAMMFAMSKITSIGAAKINAISLAMIGMAQAIRVLASGLKEIGDIKSTRLLTSVIALTSLMIALSTMVLIISKIKISGILKVNSIALSMVTLALSMKILVGCLTDLDCMNINKTSKNVKLLISLMISLSSVISVMSLFPTKSSMASVGLGMLSMAGSISLLVSAMTKISNLNPKQALTSLGVVELLLVSMGAISLLVSRFAGKGKIKGIVGMIAIASSVYILVSAMTKISNLNPKQALTSLGVVELLLVSMSKIVNQASKSAGKGKIKGIVGMIAIASSVYILVSAMTKISNLNPKQALTSLGVVELLLVSMSGIMVLFNKVSRTGKMKGITNLLLLSFSIKTLVSSIKDVSDLEPYKALISLAVIEILLLTLSKVLKSMNKCSSNTKLKNISSIILIAISLGIVVNSMKSIADMDSGNMLKSLLTVEILIHTLSGIIKSFNRMDTSNSVKGSMAIIAVVLCVKTLVGVMKDISDMKPKEILISIGVIGTLIGALTGIMILMKTTDRIASGSLFAAVKMVAVIGAIGAVVGILSAINGKRSIESVTCISLLLTSMAVSLKLLQSIGNNSSIGKAVLGITGLSLILIGLTGILKVMEDMDFIPSKESIESLSLLILALSASCVLLEVAGLAAGAAMSGLGVLATLVVGLGALLTALGGLNDYFDGKVGKFINEGIPLLESIGKALGSFFGNIISGFVDGMNLPEIGKALGDFMVNLQPFLYGMSNINSDTLDGVANLASIIMTFSQANLLNSLSSFLTGDREYESFGKNLKSLADGLVGFTKTIGDTDFSNVPSAVESLKTLAEMMNALPKTGGIAGTILGDRNLDDLLNNLPNIGKAIVDFSAQVSGNIDGEAIVAAANAGKALSELYNNIPKTGGSLQDWFGTSDLSLFAQQMKELGEALKHFAEETKDIDASKVTAAGNAIQVLTQLYNNVPASNGFLQSLMGEKDLGNFATQLKWLGNSLKYFAEETKDVDSDKVVSAKNAIEVLTQLYDKLPSSNGFIQSIMGEKDLSTFGSQLQALGSGIKHFAEETKDIDASKVTAAGNAIVVLTELQSNLPETGGLKGWFYGEKDLSAFGSTLKGLGQGVSDFGDTVADVNVEQIQNGVNACKSIMELITPLMELENSDISEKPINNFKKAIIGVAESLNCFTTNTAEVKLDNINSAVEAAKSLLSISPDFVKLEDSIEMFDYVENFINAINALSCGMFDFNENTKEIDKDVLIKSVEAAKKVLSILSSFEGLNDCLDGGTSYMVEEALGRVANGMKTFFESSKDIDTELVITKIHAIEEIAKVLKNIEGVKSDAISSFITALNNAGKLSVDKFIEPVENSPERISNAVSTMMNAFTTAISSHKPEIVSTFKESIDECINTIENKISEFKDKGTKVITEFLNGINSKKTEIINSINTIINSMISTIDGYYNSLYSSGQYLVKGFANGIKDSAYLARAEASYMASRAAKAIETELDINSPSKVTYALGGFFGKGFRNGVSDTISSVVKTTTQMGDMAVDSLSETISSIGEMVTDGIDMNSSPVITPVMDMTNIQNGFNKVDSMLSNQRLLSLAESISYDRKCNTSLAETIDKAVNKAINRIEKIRNDEDTNRSYQFNIISDIDGRNVAKATAVYTQEELDKIQKRNSRKRGEL